MNDGKALRPISRLFGESYGAGDPIPGAVIARMTPQVVRSLVDRGDLEVAGLTPQASIGTGGVAHLTARIDKLVSEIKSLQGRNTALEARLDVLESKTSNTAPSAEPAPRKSRRAVRVKGEQE